MVGGGVVKTMLIKPFAKLHDLPVLQTTARKMFKFTQEYTRGCRYMVMLKELTESLGRHAVVGECGLKIRDQRVHKLKGSRNRN